MLVLGEEAHRSLLRYMNGGIAQRVETVNDGRAKETMSASLAKGVSGLSQGRQQKRIYGTWGNIYLEVIVGAWVGVMAVLLGELRVIGEQEMRQLRGQLNLVQHHPPRLRLRLLLRSPLRGIPIAGPVSGSADDT